nr:hypothetical protein Iba_chr02dCG1640 [Ipomoea batatas]
MLPFNLLKDMSPSDRSYMVFSSKEELEIVKEDVTLANIQSVCTRVVLEENIKVNAYASFLEAHSTWSKMAVGIASVATALGESTIPDIRPSQGQHESAVPIIPGWVKPGNLTPVRVPKLANIIGFHSRFNYVLERPQIANFNSKKVTWLCWDSISVYNSDRPTEIVHLNNFKFILTVERFKFQPLPLVVSLDANGCGVVAPVPLASSLGLRTPEALELKEPWMNVLTRLYGKFFSVIVGPPHGQCFQFRMHKKLTPDGSMDFTSSSVCFDVMLPPLASTISILNNSLTWTSATAATGIRGMLIEMKCHCRAEPSFRFLTGTKQASLRSVSSNQINHSIMAEQVNNNVNSAAYLSKYDLVSRSTDSPTYPNQWHFTLLPQVSLQFIQRNLRTVQGCPRPLYVSLNYMLF